MLFPSSDVTICGGSWELLHKRGVPECAQLLMLCPFSNVTICNGSWFVCLLEMYLILSSFGNTPIFGFTKNDTFSNKENLFRPVLGCMTSSGGVQSRVFHKITSCIQYINRNARDLPKKGFSAGAKIRAARVTYPEYSYTSYIFLSYRSKLVRS